MLFKDQMNWKLLSENSKIRLPSTFYELNANQLDWIGVFPEYQELYEAVIKRLPYSGPITIMYLDVMH